MGVADKIHELEEEMSKTQKNKATEGHLGLLKAKIARLKRESESTKKSGKSSGGFDVKKAGNATVVFIGLPSVGKSTLLNALTGAKSKTAAYAFTTLTCIPGMLSYKGAQIQLLDLPGIIVGASTGKGRGREVIAVARNADLVMLIVDVFEPGIVEKLKEELYSIGIRLDEEPPEIKITPIAKGGLEINYSIKPTHLNDKLIQGVLKEYGIHSAEVNVRCDATVDQLIDVLNGNRKYANSLTILNKVDLVKPEFLKTIGFPFVPISAQSSQNIESLKEAIYQKLNLIRVYTKSRFDGVDKEPMMLRSNSSIGDACDAIHRDLRSEFKYCQVWGTSAKHPGQKQGLEHKLKDGDTIYVHKK